MAKISKKICMVGDFSVGKTSLIRRFVDGQFDDKYLSTVGVKISRKEVNLPEGAELQLLIWDIEGQTKFKAIAPSYLQGAKGAIIVADVSRQETIENISNHLNLFAKVNPKGKMVVALNKADLVDDQKLEALLKSNQYPDQPVIKIYGTSAKSGDNVNQLFQDLAQAILAIK
ncbi:MULTISPECIES: Rab family GTPase [unclassified Roseofilum]|uniref:Rab family GTPase n=1 Tax=unclassified Roseofilum TaxID=2620099 RepID=UPI000E933DCA|nr:MULTISPECIES: Rab family GTPase [unclassified Roseofilum]MBP0009963.1 GTP-binding protein [Roseofilum sp. Belize Diploria]MBP0034359.1 GTP-binding protein [Roseofilum sp. Belize BBD 4]HBQ99619.1 GTP-binding protein [Cyanobacteria bacterium UBA11691]